MFRRPQKGPEENALYDEKKMNPYTYKEPEKELPPRMFDTGAKPNPLKHPSAPSKENWNEKVVLPHHFQELVKEEQPETTLGEGVHVIGQLKFERLLKIDGIFEGELISKGKVLIGPQGVVKANLNLKEAVIEGKVEGNICCEERVELRGNAAVYGDISTKSLVIEEGVIIKGHVQIACANPKPTED